MNYCRPCGCKGIRTCLICEKEYDLKPTTFFPPDQKKKNYIYCYSCGKAWPEGIATHVEDCPKHSGECISVDGIFVLPDFITDAEKENILKGINMENWEISQSGRRKQNYGPKCNFKKRKIQLGNFNGFPAYSKVVHDKFKTLPILRDFKVIEQCSLEYDPTRGASIDPHIDDCWIWGERIVTVNVLGNTFLSLSKYKGDKTKYNLSQVDSYPCILDKNGGPVPASNTNAFCFNSSCDQEINNYSNVRIRVFMPEKSLIILYNSARYEWEHYVLREDIKSLRICLAYREFTPPYLPGGEKEEIGSCILNMSDKFW